jgi:transcriptional regulator of NAD metabolism
MKCVCVTVISLISDFHEMKEVIVKHIGRIGCNEDRLVPRSYVDL